MGNSMGIVHNNNNNNLPSNCRYLPQQLSLQEDVSHRGNFSPQSRLGPSGASALKRNHPDGQSTMSLSDDHFDQYTIRREKKSNFGLPKANIIGLSAFDDTLGSRLRRNRPSLIRQSEVNDLAVCYF